MPGLRTFAVTSLGACLALVILLYHGQTTLAAAAKLVASTAFIALALRAGALNSIFGRLILVGLGLSWCGDMLLIGTSEAFFLGGLVAFLLAHVAYVSAFVAHGYQRSWVIAAAIPITVIAIAVWTWLEPFAAANLSIPVRAYIAVISLMVIFAIGTRGAAGSWLIVIGATLFFLSDLSVAALRIVQTDIATYVVGLPFYYAGQVCLALSVSQSRSH
ncbi:MAG: lysoplasmalogenase [Woeseiaceae bacterium]|nr:lysoplasmalogenase [Woeseiaceae bacterium]